MSRSPDFHIDRNGTWRYRGSVIEREAMVRLFAGMLCKRGEHHVLRTPEQEVRVRVMRRGGVAQHYTYRF